MSGGDTGKVFVGEYRVEAVRGQAGGLAGLRLHLDANILLKLLTDPAEPSRTTVELAGVDSTREEAPSAFGLPPRLAARVGLGVGFLGLCALVWVAVSAAVSGNRGAGWQGAKQATSAVRVDTPASAAAPPALVAPPVATPLQAPSAPIRIAPNEPAPSSVATPSTLSAPAKAAPSVPVRPAQAPARPPAARATGAKLAAQAAPRAPLTSGTPAGQQPVAAAPALARPTALAPGANVLDLFDDTK